MTSDTNPYQAPDEAEFADSVGPKFAKWSNFRLITLFFLPSLILALSLIISRLTQQVIFSGVALSIVASIAVSILSAQIHTVRQEADWKTLALFTFVYLLAQSFALLLCTATLWIFVTRF